MRLNANVRHIVANVIANVIAHVARVRSHLVVRFAEFLTITTASRNFLVMKLSLWMTECNSC